MTSLALQLDNVDVCSSNSVCDSAEQITKLFPKCRPRSDVNLNPVIISTKEHELIDNAAHSVMNIDRDTDRSILDCLGSEYRSQDESVDDVKQNGIRPLEEESTDDDEYSDELIIDHSDSSKDNKVVILTSNKGGTYKLRDSRIIEIAGGREIFSQSRSKAARKSRVALNNEELDKKKSNKALSQGVWELRGSYNEAKKLKTTREFTETIFSSEVSSVRHQRSEKQQNSPKQVTVSGDIVVFDDIGDCCQEMKLNYHENNKLETNEADSYDIASVGTSPTPVSVSEQQQIFTDFFKGMISDLEETIESDKDNTVTTVIGNLPIAVYEGSPRRYGPRHVETSHQSHPTLPSAHSLLASPSVYPPRPGFPQRVLCSPTKPEPGTDIPVIELEKTTPGASTFDYLYEFSETRKVLEEFFKCPPADEDNRYDSEFQDLDYELRRQAHADGGSSYVGQRLAKSLNEQDDIYVRVESPKKHNNNSTFLGLQEHEVLEHENNFLDLSVGTGSSGDLGETEVGLQVGHSRNFTLSPETTDCDSNCGDLDSEVSLMLMDELGPSVGLLGSTGDLAMPTDSSRLYSSMPVLEDGLSSGHASDTDNNNPTVMLMKKQITEIEREIIHKSHNDTNKNKPENGLLNNKECLNIMITTPIDTFHTYNNKSSSYGGDSDIQENNVDSMVVSDITPPPPAPAPHRSLSEEHSSYDVEAAIKDIRLTLQRTKILPLKSSEECEENTASPIWVPRQRGLSGTSGESDTRKIHSGEEGGDEEEADTDLETDRLLGQQRTDDQGFYDDKGWRKPKSRTIMPPNSISKSSVPKQIVSATPQLANNNMCDGSITCTVSDIPGTSSSPPCSPRASEVISDKTPSPQSQKGSTTSNRPKEKESKKKSRNKEGFCDNSVLIEGVLFRARYLGSTQLVCEGQPTKTTRMMQAEEAVSRIKEASNQISSQSYHHCAMKSPSGLDDVAPLDVENCDDTENSMKECSESQAQAQVYPAQLPLGVSSTGTVFRLHYLGSVEVEEEGGRKRRKRLKKNMVEEAVIKIKAPEGETQPSTEVDLFISTEKIMVLNTDLKEIMMDHALRTISYIADIGDLVVLMARRRFVPHEMDEPSKISRTPKMICHVFESEEAQFIAQSIGQAFQVAYMEFLKANGIEDHSFVKEMDYQEVLNSQEIFGDELQMFAKKEMQKEVVVPKAKGEILGVVIVESGWGSMLPTVVIANLAPAGAAARCGQLNIGDQIIAINGVSLVGLPLSTCQNYIKNSKNQTVVKLTVVPCAPVVEVKIKRPDTKYQLGFSVQNGVICSLLRGGIAERGGVRVGHRIIEINNQSVVAVPHEKIVNLLATSVGEILMKTMPTSMFRLLTGQENPVYI